MRVHDIQTLYAYNAWANELILSAAEQVPAEQFASARLGACSLSETLVHLMVSESLWRLRWQGVDPATVAFPDSFPTLAAVRAQWQRENVALGDYLAGLSDALLAGTVTFQRPTGPDTRVLWHLMLHVVNHGTQHRAELALLLTELGCSPGDLDFTRFLREQPA
ncbi:MAG TPA: DinB family protein [Herpetosiphonaceae bacterium]